MNNLIIASFAALTFFRASLAGAPVVELPCQNNTMHYEYVECLDYKPTFDEPMMTEIQRLTTAQEIYNCEEVNALCKLVYGEARNCTVEVQAAAVWCVLNRVDDERFPDTILEVVKQPSQFFGYKENFPVLPEIQELVVDVLDRWAAEKSGVEDVARVLPKEYLYFSGDGKQNYFTIEYNSRNVWDWSLYNPYTE